VAYVRTAGRHSSGYLLAPRLVLTAAHCVDEVGGSAEVQVLRPGSRQGAQQASPVAPFRVVALSDRSETDGVDGFALLRALEDDPFGLEAPQAVRWGRLTGGEPLAAEAYAFPALAVEGRRRNLEHTFGSLIPGTGTVTGPQRTGWYLDFDVDGRSCTGDRWRGASGAAVFAENRLLGLVGAHAHGRLKVIPVQLLGGQEPFLRLLAEGGAGHVVFEPVWKGQRRVLEPPYVPLPDSASAADLLLPRHSVVEFCGHAEELRELTEWCTAPAPHKVSVRLLTGDRSVGKTRLARELCARMTGLGWVAGLLKPLAGDVSRLMDLDEDRLIVVDDADGEVGQLDALLRHRGGTKQVRLLTTARQEGQWWSAFRRRYGEVAQEGPYRLRGPDPAQRAAVYEKACAAFLRREPGWKQGDGLPHASADLCDPDFASCLFVLILAMTDVRRFLDPRWDAQSGLAGPASLAHTLYEKALDLEREDWVGHAAQACLPTDRVLLERVVAVSSLAFAGGDTVGERESQAAERLRMVPDLRDATEEHRRRFVRYFQQRIDGYGALRPLRPARLAQHLVTGVVRAFPELVSQALDVDPAQQPEARARQALATLQIITPAAFDGGVPERPKDPALYDALRAGVEKHAPALVRLVRATLETTEGTTSRSLATALETVFRNLPAGEFTATAARELEEASPDALQALTIVLRQKAVEFHSWQEPLSDEAQFLRARENRKLSRVLADAGRRHEAHACALQAVQQFNVLTRVDNSYPYVLGKAHALSNLAVRHREIGRFTESLETARDAVRIYETLLHDHPDRSHHRYLSIAQCNLSDSLADVGRWREALQYATDARDLVTGRLPAAGEEEPPLNPWEIPEAQAQAWCVLARRQVDAQEFADAIDSAGLAKDAYRRLLAVRCGRWERDFAWSVAVLGRCHSGLGRWDESIAVLTEAVALYEDLEHQYQEAERPHHTEMLCDLASAYLHKAVEGGPDCSGTALAEGLRWAEKARRHHDDMAPEERNAERAHNARTMGVQAELELARHEPRRARDLAERALDILDQHVRDKTWKHRCDRIRLTRVYGEALKSCGDGAAADAQLRRADSLEQILSDEEPGRHWTGLTVSSLFPAGPGRQVGDGEQEAGQDASPV